MSDKDSNFDNLKKAAISGSAYDNVQRYGSAVKEHIKAYTGIDNENLNDSLKKGLKDMSKYKVNAEYVESNLKQQAGFAAEVKYQARQNAEHIIKGDKVRVQNTDLKYSGKYNELYDHVVKNGNIVVDAQQMKFVGNNANECIDKLLSKDFDKYYQADATFTIPSDYFQKDKNGVSEYMKVLNDKENECLKQLRSGRLDDPAKAQDKAKVEYKLEKIKALKKGKIKNSEISKQEAMEARVNPEMSTLKDIGLVSHRAGFEQAKLGAVVGGTLSLVANAVSLCQRKKDFKEAAKDLAIDTGESFAIGYGTGFAGAALKGAMQNSSSEILRTLSKTNLPATVVTTALTTGKILFKYLTDSEVSGVQCLEQLGEAGTSMASSAMMAAVGQLCIPIPVVGAMVGSMVGYVLSSTCYNVLLSSLKSARLAKENRVKIEVACEAHRRNIQIFIYELNKNYAVYIQYVEDTLSKGFNQMKEASRTHDTDKFIQGSNIIVKGLGRKVQFTDKKSFDKFMESDEALEL